ncbi:DNRLRE domain-containing protein [Streptomyces sp. NPDC020965]|uniref:DNRLRE domain-containing protein n=1 Tax=Streptomyces sp. NPDC020965 TaxID=3365105 RepID=UPI0037BC34D0
MTRIPRRRTGFGPRALRYPALALAGVLALETAAFAAGTALNTPKAAPASVAAEKANAEATAEATARARAGFLGKRVEVTELRTESSTTYINPDGTKSIESATGPIRVKDAKGAWQPVDTTLVFEDGTVRPRYAAADIELSDGGTGPLAEVAKGAQSLGIGWEGNLPKPVLKGNTATYRDVQPGADLVVTALPEGFSHFLILKEKPTEQVELRLPVTTKALKLRETADERLLWEDRKGADVATAPVPVMWDASKSKVSGEPESVSKVAATVENGGDGQTLVLKPSQAFMNDPDVTYPVTVDPTNTLLGPLTDTWLQHGDYPTSQRGSTELKAGTYNGTEKARSFLKWDVAAFAGKQIIDTDLRLFSHWSSTCATTGSGIQARRITSDWDPSAIAWSAQPTTSATAAIVSKAAKGYNSSCPGGLVSWDVDGIVQAWADGQPNYGIRLAAVDETDPLTWRRYRSANFVSGRHDAATEPTLTVTVNSTPTVPTAVTLSPLKGAGTTVASLTPSLSALVDDPDGGSSLKAEFEVAPDPAFADTTYTWTGTSEGYTPGSQALAQIPTTAPLPDGGHLRVRARTTDGVDTSAWSGWTVFRVDAASVLPADLPTHTQTGATDSPAPLATGVVTSPNGGMVDAEFRLTGATTTTVLGTQSVPDGDRAGFQIPANLLTSGGPFTWSMRGCYEGKCSAWTAPVPVAPGTEPTSPAPPAPLTVTLPLATSTACVDGTGCTSGSTTAPLKVGTVGASEWRSHIKPDLSVIPAGARVLGANLQLSAAAPGLRVGAHALNAAWAPTGTLTALDDVTAPGVNTEGAAPGAIDVSGLVMGWHDGSDTNHGLVLRRTEDEADDAGATLTGSSIVVSYTPATAPSVPLTPQATPGDGGALITWDASTDSGHNGDDLTYTVEALDPLGAVVATRTTKTTDQVFTGLTNGTAYTFRVSAANVYGVSGTVATAGAVEPLAAPLGAAVYDQSVREFFEARASLTTGQHTTAAAAAAGRPNAAKYLGRLGSEQSYVIDARDALLASSLTPQSATHTFSDVLVIPAADGSVTVRVAVSETISVHDGTTAEDELGESIQRLTFTGGTTPVLHGSTNARQVEQRLSADEGAYGAVTHGVKEAAPPVGVTVRDLPLGNAVGEGIHLGANPSRFEGQYTAFGTIKASGTAKYALDNWNKGHEFDQDCTNFVSKALNKGGGMRMKGVLKNRKNNDYWYRAWEKRPFPLPDRWKFSHTWTVSYWLSDFFIGHSDGSWLGESQSKAKVGDIVFFKWKGDSKWGHSAVVTKMKKGKAYLTYHSRDKKNVTYDSVMKRNKGAKASIVRVKPGWY